VFHPGDLFRAFCAFAFGVMIGSFALSMLAVTPVFVPPAPAPLPILWEEPEIDRDLVVGLSEVLIEAHREAVAARAELEAVKHEARQIISAMVAEIERLNARPTLRPGDKTAELPHQPSPSS